jgi:hypothetical protein
MVKQRTNIRDKDEIGGWKKIINNNDRFKKWYRTTISKKKRMLKSDWNNIINSNDITLKFMMIINTYHPTIKPYYKDECYILPKLYYKEQRLHATYIKVKERFIFDKSMTNDNRYSNDINLYNKLKDYMVDKFKKHEKKYDNTRISIISYRVAARKERGFNGM